MACDMMLLLLKLTWMCSMQGLNVTGIMLHTTLNNQITTLHPGVAGLLYAGGTRDIVAAVQHR